MCAASSPACHFFPSTSKTRLPHRRSRQDRAQRLGSAVLLVGAAFSSPNTPYECRTRAGRALVKKIQDEAAAAGKPDPFLNVPEEIRRGLPVESLDVADNELGDGQLADRAIAVLRGMKQPSFFIGLGFVRPHLPFVAPKKYFDLYDPAKLPLTPVDTVPAAMPALAVNDSSELRTQYREVPAKGPMPEPLARHLLHGYLACVSYVDAQIGRVLDELDRLGLSRNTAQQAVAPELRAAGNRRCPRLFEISVGTS